MEPFERGLLSFLGTVHSGVTFLVAVAVILLGIVVVRPLHASAGMLFAIAGGARLVGQALDFAFHALRPSDADLDSVLVFSAIGTLMWFVTAVIFWGGVAFGAVKLSEPQGQPRAAGGAS